MPEIAVAVPAYNEADGIGGFIAELATALSGHTVAFVVADDASSDGTADVAAAAGAEVLRADRNRGHGPTLLAAYRRALELDPDYVLAVDGDGQFAGADLRRALVLLEDQAHAVCGVRRFRQDPWFRMVMTRLVRRYVDVRWHVHARDPNCPLRGYDAAVLAALLEAIPADALIPNLYLTVVAAQRGLTLLEVDVSHQARRGASAEGTGLGRGQSPIPWRLVRFSLSALIESLRFRPRAPSTPTQAKTATNGSSGAR